MYCTSCGTLVSAEQQHCSSCGQEISAGGAGSFHLENAGAQRADPGERIPTYDQLNEEGVELPVGDVFREAWDITNANLGPLLLGSLVVTVLSVAVASLGGITGWLATPLTAGIQIAILRLLHGESLQVANFFDGFRRFMPLLLVGLLNNALVTAGALFLLLPGIYLGIAFTWAVWLVLDRDENHWEALKGSVKVVNGSFGPTFVLLLALAGVNLLGALACGLGAIFTLPFSLVALGVAYRRIFGLQGRALDLAE